MEFPPALPRSGQPFWRRHGVLLAVLALCLYAALLARFMDGYAGGSDTSGYLNHAKLLAAGHLHAAKRTLEGLPPAQTPFDLYTPLGFIPARDGRGLVPTYPPGLPLLVAAASHGVGWDKAGGLVVGLHALLGVLLIYALGRALGLPRAWAVFGAAVIAFSPLYLQHALQIMSDVPSLAWVTAAVLAAWRSGDTKIRNSEFEVRNGLRWALAAGGALALAVLIRPNNIIALAPLAVALGRAPRRWLMFGLGGMPGAVFFGAHSKAAYGSVLATGYGSNGYLFSTAFIPGTLLHYAHWLPLQFTPLIALSLGLPWLGRARFRAAAVLGAWIVAYLAFYAPYSSTHETWWYLRYVLPAAPALVLGGLLVARQRSPFPRGWVVLAVVLTLVNEGWWVRKFGVLHTARRDRTYPLAMEWLRDHVPSDSVLAVWQASGAVFYYTPFTLVRWDLLFDARTFPHIVDAARAADRPIYAVLFPYECDEALQKRMPGAWAKVGAIREVTVWKWMGRKAARDLAFCPPDPQLLLRGDP